jgi:hypothetical protein
MEFGSPHWVAQTLAVSGKTQAMSHIIARRERQLHPPVAVLTRQDRTNALKVYPAKAPA